MFRTATNTLNSTNKWQSWWGHKKVMHNQVLAESKTGLKEPDEWQEQSQSHKHVRGKVIRYLVFMAWPKEKMESLPSKHDGFSWCTECFTPSLAPWDHTLKEGWELMWKRKNKRSHHGKTSLFKKRTTRRLRKWLTNEWRLTNRTLW